MQAVAPPAHTALPAVWRDPWAWLVAVSVLPLFVVGRGIPFGEAVLDDFDFLHETLFRQPIDWFSGHGISRYWRPVSRQLYYQLISPFAVQHPALVVCLQAVLLALAGVLLYRALRPAWPAPVAAAAATFPIALEASVQLVSWSSSGQDVLALLFGAALLHALSRGRTGAALAFLALALLSKEIAVAFAAAMPLWPALTERDGRPATWRRRVRVAGSAGAVLAAWWLVHEWVARRAGQVPAPTFPGMSPWEQWIGAVRRVSLEAFNLGDARSPVAAWIPALILIVTVAAVGVTLRSATRRTRMRTALPWLAWAAVWTGLSVLPVAWFLPSWGSYRVVPAVVGIGIGLVALLHPAGAWAVALVFAMRIVALLAISAVPQRIPGMFASTSVEFDVASMGAMQRLVHEVRVLATREHPTLPRGATIARFQWPRMSAVPFMNDKAFRVWYRDSTLRVVETAQLYRPPYALVDLAVDFEPVRTPQFALIAPRALQLVLLAADSLRSGRAAAAEHLLAGFEREQPDTNAAVFLATGLALRGAALLAQGRLDAGALALDSALRWNANDPNAHRLLAELHQRRGRVDLAVLELERHLALAPGDSASSHRLEALLPRVR